METNEQTEFQQLLFEAWLDFQREAGQPVSQKDFAEYLGINNTLLSHYFKGKRTPRRDGTLRKLAAKLGQELYPALGLASPDPVLQELERRLHRLPEEVKERIREMVLVSDGERINL